MRCLAGNNIRNVPHIISAFSVLTPGPMAFMQQQQQQQQQRQQPFASHSHFAFALIYEIESGTTRGVAAAFFFRMHFCRYRRRIASSSSSSSVQMACGSHCIDHIVCCVFLFNFPSHSCEENLLKSFTPRWYGSMASKYASDMRSSRPIPYTSRSRLQSATGISMAADLQWALTCLANIEYRCDICERRTDKCGVQILVRMWVQNIGVTSVKAV